MFDEVDHAGNPMCGQDFMAGTICSDVPGHDGPHSATCQTCGGDWINDTCTCHQRCVNCGTAGYVDVDTLRCEDCAPGAICDVTGSSTVNGRFYCHLARGHSGNHLFYTDQKCGVTLDNPVYDTAGNLLDEYATCRKPAGHRDWDAVTGCWVYDQHTPHDPDPEPIERQLRRRPAFEPVTQEEIYEVFGIAP